MDLFDLYGLNPLAAKVARVLPNGEKNGLRKTYKGKIKELNISGKFDVKLSKDEDKEKGLTGFLAMLRHPDLEWNVNQVYGKEIGSGLPQSTLAALPSALSMNKGIIPKAMWDSSVLGDVDLTEKKAAPAAHKITSSGMERTSSSSGSYARVKQQEMARPKRAIKKRGYDESSYEGYGEGYDDDDMADTGYSDGDGEDRGGKRRKKVGS